MEVRRYRPEMADAWNAFNRGARNGHFLFDRGFMDYHADRFEDCSLVVLEDGSPLALLPANIAGDEAWSHQGLTFGGLVTHGLGAARTLAALDACAEALRAAGATHLTYKALPGIYHRAPAQEDLYWLFRRGAAVLRRDLSIAIDARARGRVSSRRLRGARKAEKAGVPMGRSSDWRGFWRLLEAVLAERHGAAPVHSLAEIGPLADRFPDSIALHVAGDPAAPLAGVVMFNSDQVAHAQYIAASPEGRELGALDALFERLIAEHLDTHRYFDFGISNTDQGRTLNEGLIRQKEEFGGGGVVHEFHRLAL